MTYVSHARFAAALLTALVAACYVPVDADDTSRATANNASSSSGSSGTAALPGSSSGGAPSGVPCEVEDVLKRNACLNCHGAKLAAPMSLLTYEDWAAAAPSNAAKKVVDVVIERMASTTSPMPPAPAARASASDIEIIKKWQSSGLPKGDCGSPTSSGGSSSSGGVTEQCSSGQYWNSNEESPHMNPGLACITCHSNENRGRDRERAPGAIGGTVYPSLREPDLCLGAPGGAKVVITDAKNQTYELPVNQSGNFYLYGAGTLSYPIRAKVVTPTGERVMNTPQRTGDCNSCHTKTGKNGAPGRIMLP
jgi:mono/diheme cytochrome c family protein